EVQPHIQLRHGATAQQGVLDKLVNRMLHGYDPCALHAGIYVQGQPELIGSVSLQNWNRHEGKAVLGYMLNPLWWGRGFATEALGLLLAYGIRELGLRKVEGRCRGDNLRSEQVMLKNGLTLERILPMADGSGDLLNEVIRLLTNHRSFRQYTGEAVEPEKLKTIIEAAQAAPSWVHGQQVSIIAVRSEERKHRLSVLSGNQKHVTDAPVFLVFCMDFHRAKLAAELEEQPFEAARDVDALLVGATD
ncbi:hypothetical protein KC345_g11844, partial [Hortaea werneckii]